MLILLLCWPSQAAADVWVFFRPDIPLHIDTIERLKRIKHQKLVFCPVGNTSFSFLESQPPEFVVALGDAALQRALKMLWRVKILVTLVDQPSTDSRTLFLDTQQPYELQIQLLKTLNSDFTTIWYPYVAERCAPGSALQLAAENAGMKVNPHQLDDPRVLPEALREFAQPTTAAILPPDPGIMNNAIIQSILLASFRSQTPVVGFSEALVKQGAISAYVLTPENLAATIAEIIDEGIANRRPLPPRIVFDRWELILNQTILEKFKLPLSDELKNRAMKLF